MPPLCRSAAPRGPAPRVIARPDEPACRALLLWCNADVKQLWQRHVVAAALMVPLAAGCGSESVPDRDSADPARPDEAAVDTSREAARAELRQAVKDLANRPTVGFQLEIDFPEDAGHHWLKGGADLREDEWWITAETSSGGDEPLAWSARSEGGRTWMQMADWPQPKTGCWLEMPPGMVPLGFQGLTPGLPGYISLLGWLQADGFEASDPSVLIGHTDAGAVQALVPGQTADAMGMSSLKRADVRDTKVDLRIELVDDRIRSISTTGMNLLESWPAARDQLDDRLEPFVEEMSTTLTFLDAAPAGPSPLAPPDDLIVQMSDDGGCDSA